MPYDYENWSYIPSIAASDQAAELLLDESQRLRRAHRETTDPFGGPHTVAEQFFDGKSKVVRSSHGIVQEPMSGDHTINSTGADVASGKFSEHWKMLPEEFDASTFDKNGKLERTLKSVYRDPFSGPTSVDTDVLDASNHTIGKVRTIVHHGIGEGYYAESTVQALKNGKFTEIGQVHSDMRIDSISTVDSFIRTRK